MMNITKKALIISVSCATVLASGSSPAMAQGRSNNGGGAGGGAIGRNIQPTAQRRANYLSRMKDTLEVTDDSEWNVLSVKVGAVFDGRMAVETARRSIDQPSAAMAALLKALHDKAPAEEIKTKLKAVQDEAAIAQAKLKAAQEELRGLLTPRREAIATLNGLL